MKTYTLYWKDGTIQKIYGNDVVEACIMCGISAEEVITDLEYREQESVDI